MLWTPAWLMTITELIIIKALLTFIQPSFLPLSTTRYLYLPFLTFIYQSLPSLTPPYLYLPLLTYIYLLLPLFTSHYLYPTLLTFIYPSLPLSTSPYLHFPFLTSLFYLYSPLLLSFIYPLHLYLPVLTFIYLSLPWWRAGACLRVRRRRCRGSRPWGTRTPVCHPRPRQAGPTSGAPPHTPPPTAPALPSHPTALVWPVRWRFSVRGVYPLA